MSWGELAIVVLLIFIVVDIYSLSVRIGTLCQPSDKEVAVERQQNEKIEAHWMDALQAAEDRYHAVIEAIEYAIKAGADPEMIRRWEKTIGVSRLGRAKSTEE